MKIKKPVVGDVVICEGDACLVHAVYSQNPLMLKVVKFSFIDEGCDDEETNFYLYSRVEYPDWYYPEQTDEMIEVGDD